MAAITLVAVVAASAAYLVFRAESPKPATNGEVVVDSAPGEVAQLSAVGTDGRLRPLWRCPRARFCGSPGALSWSPDGKRIALVLTVLGLRSPYAGVNVATVRTGRLAHLSSGTRCGNGYALRVGIDWSPTGRWLAFTCGSSEDPPAPSDRERGTRGLDGLSNVESPSWSPDGRRLVFSAGAFEHSSIYVIDADGSHRRLLVRGGRAPAWSPNSSLIAYRRGTNGGACGGLRLVDANTGRDASPASAANPCHQFGPRLAGAPEWSPDGTEIAVGSASGVYVIHADGTDLRRISPTPPYSGQPAWRPAQGKGSVRYGDRVAELRRMLRRIRLTNRSFVALAALAGVATFGVAATHGAAVARNGQIAWKAFPHGVDEHTSAIYAANPDGSHRRRLTHPAAGIADDLPDWSPDGSHIVFERIFQPAANLPTVADEVMRVDADRHRPAPDRQLHGRMHRRMTTRSTPPTDGRSSSHG